MKTPALPRRSKSLTTALVPLGLACLAPCAPAAVTVLSSWGLGENSSIGADSASANDGETNPFNRGDGSTILTDSPAAIRGSTAYTRTSGSNFQGIWMFGAGANDQTIPANWGIEFMVRAVNPASITSGFRAVFGMAEGVSGGLVIEAANYGGTVYWDVNRQGIQNLIYPRNEAVRVTADWTSLALVRNSGTTGFYVDGSLVGSTSATYNTSGLFSFGLQQNVGTSGFAGDFDEARFFTFANDQFNPTSDLLVNAASAIPEPASLASLGVLVAAGSFLRVRPRRHHFGKRA